MKKTLFLLTMIALFCSCSKSVVPEEQELELEIEYEDNYLGKWKLMQISFAPFPFADIFGIYPPTLDYSKANVIFEFSTDSLLVSGEMEHPVMDWYDERGIDRRNDIVWAGVYEYVVTFWDDSRIVAVDGKSFELFVNLPLKAMSLESTGWGGYSFMKVEE